MAQLPRVAGVLSDATKLKFSNINSQLVELLTQNASPANFTNLGAAWTEVDSGTNVAVSAGEASVNGDGTYQNNGMWHTNGLTAADGYIEFEIKWPNLANSGDFFFSATNGLKTGRTYCIAISNAQDLRTYNNAAAYIGPAIAAATYYTIRIYFSLDSVSATRIVFRTTIQGGAFTAETEMLVYPRMAAALSNPFYVGFQRGTNNAGNPFYVKKVYWYSGYATDGPYTTYTHDAGAGKVFDNLDLTAVAMPGTVPSTNLKFDYYFGDDAGGALSGTWRTLANFNALGKITARYRYIKIAVQSNSDGATQVYADKPNSDTAIDGVGDFPATTALAADATVQGVAGGIALDSILSPRGTFDEAARNEIPTLSVIPTQATGGPPPFLIRNEPREGTQDLDAVKLAFEAARNSMNGTVADDIKITKSVKVANVTTDGTYNPAVIPSAAPTNISSIVEYLGWLRIVWDGVAAADYYEVYRSTSQAGTFTKISISNIIAELEYVDMDAVFGKAYWYKVRSVNSASGTTDGYSAAVYGSNTVPASPIPSSVMDGPEIGFTALNDTFANMEAAVNGLKDENFADYAQITATKILNTALTQKEVSSKTMNLGTVFSKVPRHDQNGNLWFPLGVKMGTTNPVYLVQDYAKGAFIIKDGRASSTITGTLSIPDGVPFQGKIHLYWATGDKFTMLAGDSIYVDATVTWVVEAVISDEHIVVYSAGYGNGTYSFSCTIVPQMAYVNKAADGWHNGAAPSGTAASKMSIRFDPDNTLWVVEIDGVVCACVDPLNVVGVFVGPSVYSTTRPEATADAYVAHVAASSRIEFYYDDTRIGYINSTGTHEG